MNTKLETNNNQPRYDQFDLSHHDVRQYSDLVDLEHLVQQYWAELDLVEQLKFKNRGNEKFSFFDGPVTANNPLGVHHAWGRTLKDVVQRFKSLQGYDQRFEYGFDTQGLWVEVEVEKALGFDSKDELDSYGVDRFVLDCKKRVDHFSMVQDRQSANLGMLKAKDSYYTHSDTNVSAIWTFLNLCHQNGWLYKGHRPMPWCPRCGTSLSAHEQADSYKEVEHRAAYAKFPLNDRENTYLVVWTTTPWTLPANLGVAVHPDFEYGVFRSDTGELLVAGSWLKDTLFKDHDLVETKMGSELVEFSYTTAFHDLEVQTQTSYWVYLWDGVDQQEGTGVVHLAPGCGQDDFDLLADTGLTPLSPLTEDGTYHEGYNHLSGLHYQEANKQVVSVLKARGLLFSEEDYSHRYPHCWRCKTELVYRLVEEWFLDVEEVRPQLLAAADEVEWDPSYTKKLFTNWVENMGDWCVSRKRYWGLPLPFYECDCGQLTVVKSKEEFFSKAVGPVDQVSELHLPWVDMVQFPCSSCGKHLDRVSEVGDCWLDAGVMPFSTLGYFQTENQEWKDWFPADFVCEMREQVRLWFYSMMFLSVTLTGSPPFKQVLSYEMVKDKYNQEMHKSGKNNVVLDDALKKLGADNLRLYYVSQNRSSNMRFDFEVGNGLSKLLMTLYHSFNFFKTYADLETYQFDPHVVSDDLMDRWVLSSLSEVTERYTELMEEYKFNMVHSLLDSAVDNVSSWYLRRVRQRVWNKEDGDNHAVYNTLFRVFRQLTVLFAPFTPYLAEVLYQNLRRYNNLLYESVHLEDLLEFPYSDKVLNHQMQAVRNVADLNRQLRNEQGVKLRQPLAAAYLWYEGMDQVPNDLLEVLQTTLNVKVVKFMENLGEYVNFYLKPNYEVVGPKYGNRVNELEELLRAVSSQDAQLLATGETDTIPVGRLVLDREEVEVRMSPKRGLHMVTWKNSVLLLDFTMTPELLEEGRVRDFMRHVQQERKRQDLEVEQQAWLEVEAQPEWRQVLQAKNTELCQELYLAGLNFVEFNQAHDVQEYVRGEGPVRYRLSAENIP